VEGGGGVYRGLFSGFNFYSMHNTLKPRRWMGEPCGGGIWFFFGQGRRGGWRGVFVFLCVFPSSALSAWESGSREMLKGSSRYRRRAGLLGDREGEVFFFLFSFHFSLIYLLIVPGCPSASYFIHVSCFLFPHVLFLFSPSLSLPNDRIIAYVPFRVFGPSKIWRQSKPAWGCS